MGQQLLGMVSGETQHVMDPSTNLKGKPQGRNFNTAIDQTWEMDKSLVETQRNTDHSSGEYCSSDQYGAMWLC